MNLSLDTLQKVDLTGLEPYAKGHGDVSFMDKPGHSHYPLLAYISEQYNNKNFIK